MPAPKFLFGVDHRPARRLRAALAANEEPMVEVEGWQILGPQPGIAAIMEMNDREEF